MKKMFLIAATAIFLSACTHNELLTPTPVATPQPDNGNIERPENDIPQFPGGQEEEPVSDCGLTNCHGLEIECGEEVAQVCTLQYELGDFCRQYAQCGQVEGQCQQIENATFTECKSCVEECLVLPDSADQFACEETCRAQIESL